MSGSAASISKKDKKIGPQILPDYMPDLKEDTSFQPREKENVPVDTPGGPSKSGFVRTKRKEKSHVGISA
jgi:hypothetical protein